MSEGPPRGTMRLDKWLWQARFFKTRALAAGVVAAGKLRLNAERTDKPARAVGPGDVLTFPQGARVRVVRVVALGIRRGPAAEAAGLYDDLAPVTGPAPPDAPEPARGPRLIDPAGCSSYSPRAGGVNR